MIPIYANGMNLNLNEVAFIEFRVNSQPMSGPVALIAVPYEFLKQMHSAMGQAIEQHNMKLHELQRSKGNMN